MFKLSFAILMVVVVFFRPSSTTFQKMFLLFGRVTFHLAVDLESDLPRNLYKICKIIQIFSLEIRSFAVFVHAISIQKFIIRSLGLRLKFRHKSRKKSKKRNHFVVKKCFPDMNGTFVCAETGHIVPLMLSVMISKWARRTFRPNNVLQLPSISYKNFI